MKKQLSMLCAGALGCLSLASMAQDVNTPLLLSLDLSKLGAWFHPGITVMQDGKWMLTMQKINGSDFYGDPHFAISEDKGRTWTEPAPIPDFVCKQIGDTKYQHGVADVRPFTSPNDGTVFVFGCSMIYSPTGNVYGQDTGVKLPREKGYYVSYTKEKGWSNSTALPFPDFDGNYRTACTQITFLPNNEVLIPIYLENGKTHWWGNIKSDRYAVTIGRYRQVGDKLEYISRSPFIESEIGRGMIEPSIIQLPEGGYAVTLRAEDNHGHVCCSQDGTTWTDKIAWHWDDEAQTPLTMSTTQQHWMQVGRKIYLVYTRDNGENTNVFRFRAPLYMAEAIPQKGMLIRATEKVVMPRIIGEDGKDLAIYGNFHCGQLTKDTAIITDGGCKGVITAIVVAP